MSSGKSPSSSKDYYGSMAWELGQGRLDFTWGLMLDNTLVWPTNPGSNVPVMWDSQIWQAGHLAIALDGKVYKALVKTIQDPQAGNSDWALYAIPWVAGTYATGTLKLYMGNVWVVMASPNTAAVPPAAKPTNVQDVTAKSATPWKFVSTPKVYSAGAKYWAANSIVVWQGQIWTTAVGTKTMPGAPGSDWTLWKIDRATSANPLKFTVEHVGDFYLYWGTATQDYDPLNNEQLLQSFGHPPYRNKPILVGQNFKWGTGRATPPTPILLAGRAPVQTLIVDNTAHVGVDATALDADWQANPWCVLAELMTDPIIGLGLPNSMFDATTWQAEADRCALNPQLFYISPMLESLKQVREIVADLMSYPDAFVFLSVAAVIAAGHWPHGEAPPAFGATNTVDRNALVEELKYSTALWADVATSVEVSFKDWLQGFKQRPVPASSLFAQAVLQGIQTKKFDRPHIVREAQALAWANELQKIYSQESLRGSNSIRAEKALAVVPGSVFLLTDDVLGTSTPCRCTNVEIAKPPVGTRRLTYETERGVTPQPYSPSSTNAPASGEQLRPTAVKNVIFCQTPSALGTGPNELTALATRTDSVTNSMDLWYRVLDGSSWQDLGNQTAFAVAGRFEDPINTVDNTLTVGPGIIVLGDLIIPGQVGTNSWGVTVYYDNNQLDSPPVYTTAVEGTDYTHDPTTGQIVLLATGNITAGAQIEIDWANTAFVTFWQSTPSQDLDDISAPLTADEISDNTYLVFMFKASDLTQFEIASLISVGVGVGTDPTYGQVYDVQMKRAQYGTLLGGDGSYQFTTDDIVMIVKRENLVPFTHADFATLEPALATANLIITANSAFVHGDINDTWDAGGNPLGLATDWTYTFNNRYAPTVEVLSQQVNGADVADFTGNHNHTDLFQLLLQLNSFNANLSHVAVTAVKADQHEQIVTKNLDPTSETTLLFQFTFPTDGAWRFKVDLIDDAGNQSTTYLPSDSTSIRVDAGANTSDSPFVYAYNVVGNSIRNLRFGLFRDNGFTVHYQINNRGVAPSAQGAGGGVWTTVTATTAVGGVYKTDADVPGFIKGKKTLYAYTSHAGLGTSTTCQFNIDE